MSGQDEERTRRLARVLERSGFHRQVGFCVESAGAGFARVRLPYSAGNTTAQTALHGGVIAATLDVAGALAAWSDADADPDAARGRTLSCDVSYVAGALGEDIFGEGQVLRRGKEIVYSSVRAVNAAGKLVASGSHIYRLGAGGAAPEGG